MVSPAASRIRAHSAVALQASCSMPSWAPAHSSKVTSPLRRLSLPGGKHQPAIPPSELPCPHRRLQTLLEGLFTMQRMWDTAAPFPPNALPRLLSLPYPRASRINHRTLVKSKFWTTNDSCFGRSMSQIAGLEFLFAKSGGITGA